MTAALGTPSPAANEPILLREDNEGVATLTLNRPSARNALSHALMAALQEQLDAIRNDATVRVVVLAGNGPVFCSGHDLKEMRANPGRANYEAVFEECSRLMMSLVRLPKPVIAKVHGTATAAGCQLVAMCDLAVASNAAKFATPGVHIGLFCSTPMVATSRNMARKQAMEMLLTGDPLSAEEALRFGLLNRVVEPERLDAETLNLARKIASKSPLTVKIGKEAFYKQLELGLSEAYDYASRVMTENMLARDAEEGIDAFLEKRAPVWRGC